MAKYGTVKHWIWCSFPRLADQTSKWKNSVDLWLHHNGRSLWRLGIYRQWVCLPAYHRWGNTWEEITFKTLWIPASGFICDIQGLSDKIVFYLTIATAKVRYYTWPKTEDPIGQLQMQVWGLSSTGYIFMMSTMVWPLGSRWRWLLDHQGHAMVVTWHLARA